MLKILRRRLPMRRRNRSIARKRPISKIAGGESRLSPYDRSGAADQPRELLETAADAIGDEIDQFVLEHQHQLAPATPKMRRR